MRITQEQIDRANAVNLPQFLIEHGFELKRMSHDEFMWKEHESLFIHDNQNGESGKWFRFSENHGGDNIAFVREYMDLSFRQAVELLNDETYIDTQFRPYPHQKPKFKVSKPKPDKSVEIHLRENPDCRKVIDYLCRVRGLDFSLVSELVNQGRISQESGYYGNAIFKYFNENGKLVGAEKCGTNEGEKFKSIEKGSASGYGFEIVRGNGENALFFESSIDMLSYLQMHPELDNHRLVSMIGVKPSVVVATMERYGIKPENVYLCSDNDTAGNDFASRLKEVYPDMKRLCSDKNYKDWNDQLRDIPVKEVTTEKMIVYGNKIWNYATDNSDKTIVSFDESRFKDFVARLEDSGLNYYAYLHENRVIMAVNDGDISHLQRIVGDDFQTTKSNRPYNPPMKNIIGNTPYRDIYPKEYINLDRDTALKLAQILEKEGIHYSGRIYPNGNATLTVSRNDRRFVENLKETLYNQRKRYMENIPCEGIVGNTDYHEIVNRKIIFSDYTREQFQEREPFIGNQMQYAGVIQHGKIMFMTEEQNEQNFRNLLKRADNIVAIRHKCEHKNLSEEQIDSLQDLIEKCAEKQNLTCIPAFFDAKYSAEQFQQMKQAVSAYLDKAQTPENSELQSLKAKFDKQADLSDFFAHHDYDDEQKSAIAENYDLIQSTSAFELIDESFSSDQISEYFAILRSTGYEDAEKFVENHRMMMNMSDEMLDYYSALAKHEPVYLHKESGSEFQNERIEFQEDSGFVIVGDTENESDLIHYHFQTNSPEVMISNVFESGWFEQNGYVLDGLENPHMTEKIDDSFIDFGDIPETKTELTDEEKFFQDCDIVSIMTKNVLASDEIEDLALRFYESGYIETHAPSDTAIYGNHLKEHDLYDLIYDMYSGNDISKDLAVGLVGTAKNGYAHYGENYSDYIEFSKEQTETGFLLTYGGVQREVTYQALSEKFLSMFREEYADIQQYRTSEKQAETPEKPELTEKEKYFLECDIVPMIVESSMYSPDFHELGKYFFKPDYTAHTVPRDEILFGDALHETELYQLVQQFHDGEDISAELSLALYGGHTADRIEMIDFAVEQTENGFLLTHGNAQREIPFEELGKSYLQSFQQGYQETTKEEQAKKSELTEHEKYFQGCDISAIMAKNALAENEIERLGFIFFQERYTQNHNPLEQRVFGWNLPESDAYILASHHECGENISKDLCSGIFGDYDTGWLKHGEDTLQFGKKTTETGVLLSYENVQREVSYQELANAFLNLFHEKFEEITHNRLMNYFSHNIPDIDEKTAENLIHAFDEAKRPDWQDNLIKRRRIKNALFEILDDEEKTEKAFSIISFWKYDYDEKYDAPEKTPVIEESPIHFGLLGNGLTVYDTSRKSEFTNDFITVAHISGEGNIKIYDDAIPDSDMQRIQSEADAIRQKFLQGWNKLNTYQKYSKLIDNADISTQLNMSTEKLPLEEIVEKYTPFIMFNEGERPEPELVVNVRTEEEKQSTLRNDLTRILGEEQADTFIPELLKAFENNPVSSAEDDPVKEGELKAAMFDILGDEEQTEEVYSAFLDSTNSYSSTAQQNYDIIPQNGTYSIYQLHGGEEYHGIRFESLETLQKENITLNHEDYEKVYEGELPDFKGKQTLEELFEKFNLDRPADFTGHSLSMSDIIVTEINGEQTAYYCDRFGFTEMPDFFKEKAIETEISEPELELEETNTPEIQEVSDNQQIDEDTPLFADAEVIQKIQESEHADDFRLYPDTEGEQLSLFGDAEPMPTKKTSEKKVEQYETGLIVGGVNRFKALSDDVMHGTGFQDGKFRVQDFYQKNHPTNQEFADFLKNEYGTGGHSGNDDVSFVDYDSKVLYDVVGGRILKRPSGSIIFCSHFFYKSMANI